MALVPPNFASCTPELVLARLVALARTRRGFNQADLASRLGTTQSVIWSYERGRSGFHVLVFDDFARALGFKTTELLDLFFALVEDLTAAGCQVERTHWHRRPGGKAGASAKEIRALDIWLNYWALASPLARETLRAPPRGQPARWRLARSSRGRGATRRAAGPELDPFVQLMERADVEEELGFPLEAFDRIVVTFSGGKDSSACLLRLLELGVPREKIELWHHEIDEPGEPFMDWPCTPGYVRAVAEALDVPVYFSRRVGGFRGEMMRAGTPTGPVAFDVPVRGGVREVQVGGSGPPGTRGKFPMPTGDLRIRWCSAALKIDVGRRIFTNDPRFAEGLFLYISGERAEESAQRSRYRAVEWEKGTARRRVLRWRPVLRWSEAQVWDLIARWRIVPHPGYQLGWSRISCAVCIFGDPDQWATVARVLPGLFRGVATAEQASGLTIHRKLSVLEQAERGTPFVGRGELLEVIELARRPGVYLGDVVLPPGVGWVPPRGAFRKGGGPT